jgi:hypothetical protein
VLSSWWRHASCSARVRPSALRDVLTCGQSHSQVATAFLELCIASHQPFHLRRGGPISRSWFVFELSLIREATSAKPPPNGDPMECSAMSRTPHLQRCVDGSSSPRFEPAAALLACTRFSFGGSCSCRSGDWGRILTFHPITSTPCGERSSDAGPQPLEYEMPAEVCALSAASSCRLPRTESAPIDRAAGSDRDDHAGSGPFHLARPRRMGIT